MKTLTHFFCVMVISFALLNCSSDDDSASTDKSSIEFLPEDLNGTWKITFFLDENQERTSEFDGYLFTFNVDTEDVIITSDGNVDYGGVYPFQDEYDGKTEWVIEMDFNNAHNPGDADIQVLDEDWIVRKIVGNPIQIELEESITNGTPDMLHMVKVDAN